MKEKIKISKIVEYALGFLCLFACLFITIEVIVANTSGRPPRILNFSVSYVPTPSMEPTIEAGDYVLFQGASFDDVNVDDIIIFKDKEGKFIIHRVIEEYSDYLVTKGDNNPIADSDKVTRDMVYGKYIMTLGFLSIFSGGINQNTIFFILIIIFIIMIIMQVVSIVIKAQTDKTKKEIEDEKNKLREELKHQILLEELQKIKDELMKKDE